MRDTVPVFRVAFEAVVALLLFGCIPVVVRSISANPYSIGIVRLGVATVAMAALLGARGQLRRVGRNDVLRLATIGFFFFTHWLTLFHAIKVSSASIGAIGLSTYGLHLLILGTIFGEHRAHAVDVIAMLVAAAGAVLVVPSFTLANEVFVGMLLATLSAALYATLPLLHQRWSHIDTNARTLGQFGFALLFFLLLLGKSDWRLGARDWAGLLFLAVGVTLIGHSLWVRVTTRLPWPVTSIIYYGNIPIAVALGVLLLDEPLTPRTALGASLIVTGGVLGLAARARRSSVTVRGSVNRGGERRGSLP